MTVLELVQSRAVHDPEGIALLAPGREPMSNVELLRRVSAIGDELRAAGVARRDTVAVVLPNGVDLAVALLGTMTAAVCAPLSPDQPPAALERQLAVLRPSHVIGVDSSACAAASGARAIDASLLLFTSGTTSAPKLVPLSARSLLCSAANVAAALDLGPADRCLNVMPLFHIHGIVAALLGSLRAGGSVVCTPGFDGTEVVQWVADFQPTWYTAVPTIHQAMLDTFRRRGASWAGLRVIRSSSSALPVRLASELERVFTAPVIEAYGMTEAAHQIASNPLPPAVRKPGTVGRPAGAAVAVVDEAGAAVPVGVDGDVVIRGETVIDAYVDDPEANESAFTDGWFRTGYRGRIDEDGYLTLTGRRKELINRGGEKVAPREVDDVLLEHRDVVHAVAFAVPHPRLGEDVAAAVVLRPGAQVTAAGLRTFAAERLAPFKVPRRVVVVDDIPRGPSGKLVRTSLAATLGMTSATTQTTRPHAEPADSVEAELQSIWQRVLGLDEPPSTDAEFFELGGDSLHAAELFTAVEDTFGRRLPASLLLTAPTVRDMAAALRGPAPAATSGVAVIPVQPNGSKPPLFCLVRAGSVVATRHFAQDLGPDQPVYALWIPSMHGPPDAAGAIEDIATMGVDSVRSVQPHGPYFLFGHSLGATVMYEIAQQLARDGERIALLVLADGFHPRLVDARWRRRRTLRYRLRKLFSRRGPAVVGYRLRWLVGRAPQRPRIPLPGTDALLDWGATMTRERNYVPRPAPGPVAVFATRPFLQAAGGPDLGWAGVLTQGWWSCEVPGDHDTMLGDPHVHVLTERLREGLDRAAAGLVTSRA